MLNVWKPAEAIAGGYALAAVADDGRAWNAKNDAARGSSAELALAATMLAQAHGLVAEPLTESMGASVWETVIASARTLGASLIVTGGRGLSGLRELVSGSLSHRLIQHSEVPVLVVPAPKAP
jgi:nucleotide-binding universal stress UspA family protein